jgi:hypothetical protein
MCGLRASGHENRGVVVLGAFEVGCDQLPDQKAEEESSSPIATSPANRLLSIVRVMAPHAAARPRPRTRDAVSFSLRDRPPSDAPSSATVEAEAAAEQQNQNDDDEQEFYGDLLSSTACSSAPAGTRMETPFPRAWPLSGSDPMDSWCGHEITDRAPRRAQPPFGPYLPACGFIAAWRTASMPLAAGWPCSVGWR